MNRESMLFLIVDDEPDMCWALEHILEKNGYLSKKALSGKDALMMVDRNRFCLAFLDAKLPDVEGLKLAKKLREVDPVLSIIMVSGFFYKDDIDVRKAMKDGLIRGFISKPFSHGEIVKTIENICKI